jgi:hypothetical protein
MTWEVPKSKQNGAQTALALWRHHMARCIWLQEQMVFAASLGGENGPDCFFFYV